MNYWIWCEIIRYSYEIQIITLCYLSELGQLGKQFSGYETCSEL